MACGKDWRIFYEGSAEESWHSCNVGSECPACLRAEVERLRADLKETRDAAGWVASIEDPSERVEESTRCAALVAFKRWERRRGPGAAGNPIYQFEDFLLHEVRAIGDAEARKLREELETARAALVESLEARRITEEAGGPVAQLNAMVDELRAALTRSEHDVEAAFRSGYAKGEFDGITGSSDGTVTESFRAWKEHRNAIDRERES